MERTMKMMAMACMLALGLALAGCGDAGSGSPSAASESSAAPSTSSGQAASSSAAEASSAATQKPSSSASGDAAPSAAAETDRTPFVGTWKMVAMSDGTDVLQLKNAAEETRENLNITFTLNEDGSAAYSNPLYELKGTWKALSDTVAKIEFEPTDEFGNVPAYEATLEDGTLAIQEDNLVMLLEKE